MTILTFDHNHIATDSLVTNSGKDDGYVDKFLRFDGGRIDGNEIIAVAAAGNLSLIEKIQRTFLVDLETKNDLLAHMTRFKYANNLVDFVIIYMVDKVAHSCLVTVGDDRFNVYKTVIEKNTVYLQGSGVGVSNTFKDVYFDDMGAKERAWLVSKLSNTCGGAIKYINYNSPGVTRTYIPTEKSEEKIIRLMVKNTFSKDIRF